MKAEKKVYIVRGSEDGNLGVFTNFKLAYNAAFDYTKSESGVAYFEFSSPTKENPYNRKRVESTYSKVQRNFKGILTIESDRQCSAEIEMFYLNYYPY